MKMIVTAATALLLSSAAVTAHDAGHASSMTVVLQ